MLALCGALALAAPSIASAEPSSEPFEILPGSFQMVPSTSQAGAHEDLTTSFDFAHDPNGKTHNDVRTITLNLPAGFDASDTAVPTCPLAALLGFTGSLGQLPTCPIASQVGMVSFEIANPKAAGLPPAHITVPVYNMEVTSFGVAAELGFKTAVFSSTIQASVRPGDSGITVTTPNIPKVEVRNVVTTIWGVPAAHEHDSQRGETCGAEEEVPAVCRNEFGGPQPAGIQPRPFLSNPTSCGTFTATLEANSWEEPLVSTLPATTEIGPITGCERVPFEPSIELQPTTTEAESPSGLNANVLLPQTWENPVSLSTSNLSDASVALPPGVTINPSSGSGLAACTPQQYAAETSSSLPGQGCPQESKIGSVEIETPILAEKISGDVFVASPFDNPFDSLLSLYVVARDPQRGILVKVAGQVHLNETTGQIVTTFPSVLPNALPNMPQQPFSHFTLKFRPGVTAPLVSPARCGSYTPTAELTPWSALGHPDAISSPPFAITSGVHGSACPSGGVPPFGPQVVAGTENNAGGSYSAFYLRLIREDGEQEVTKFTTVMPDGLSGNLTGIPFCPDSAIQSAREVSGSEELSHPSCPAASEIGHTLVGAGVGPVLAWTPGKLYLAGPYRGSALSLVSITSAKVGPFDLGTVVIRFALRINPTTAQVEVDSNGSDPIPHIIDGIVVHVRDIRAYVDRPGFILNPTNCQRMSIQDTVTGAGADYANPADQMPVTVTTPFQASDCSSLGFRPKFTASTSGRTSRSKGASLDVKLTYPKAPPGTQANIRSVKVDLPKQLPSRLTTLQQACREAVFDANPASCPSQSRVGTAIAHTPILPVPLTGPAYFVSHGGAKFPELIIVLQGYGITIDLHGETFISKQNVTSSTFRTVPDQPVTDFSLNLPQGPFSALAANQNLCTVRRTVMKRERVTVRSHGHTKKVTKLVKAQVTGALPMPTVFTAQNGMTLRQTTMILVTGCSKAKPKAKQRRARH